MLSKSYADNETQDQPAHARNLTKAMNARLQNVTTDSNPTDIIDEQVDQNLHIIDDGRRLSFA